MSSGPLPEYVDAHRLFAHGAEIRGSIAFGNLQRLKTYLLDQEAPPIEVELQFSRDRGRQRVLDGRLRATLPTRCQRCLGTLQVELDSRFSLVVAGSQEELRALDDELDTLLCTGDDLNLLSIIEDELILGLPLVPSHDNTDCSAMLSKYRATGQEEPGTANPFASLKQLRAGLTEGTGATGEKNKEN